MNLKEHNVRKRRLAKTAQKLYSMLIGTVDNKAQRDKMEYFHRLRDMLDMEMDICKRINYGAE